MNMALVYQLIKYQLRQYVVQEDEKRLESFGSIR